MAERFSGAKNYKKFQKIFTSWTTRLRFESQRIQTAVFVGAGSFKRQNSLGC